MSLRNAVKHKQELLYELTCYQHAQHAMSTRSLV